MPTSIVYALAAFLLMGTSDFLYKSAARAGMRTAPFLIVQSICFLLTLVVTASLAFDFAFTVPATILGVICGLFAFGGFFIFVESFHHIDASVATAIFRLGFVVTSLLAIVFLGERMTPLKLVGTASAVAALGLFVPGRSANVATRGMVLVSGAMVLSGIMRFCHKIAGEMGVAPTSILIFQSLTFLALAVLATRLRGEPWRPNRAALRYAPLSGVLLSGANILLLLALRDGDATTIVPVVQLSFALTAVLSFVILREPITPRKVGGVAAAALTVALFARAG